MFLIDLLNNSNRFFNTIEVKKRPDWIQIIDVIFSTVQIVL